MSHHPLALRPLLFLAALSAPALAQTTERASVGTPNVQGDLDSYVGSLSADGRFIAFFSEASNLVPGDTNGVGDAFVRDRLARTTERVSVSTAGVEANATSDFYRPAISGDGLFVAFQSSATNLVTGDTNGFEDIFLRDLGRGITVRVSKSLNGQADDDSLDVVISGDGRYVAFDSRATNLVGDDTNLARDVFVYNRVTRQIARASLGLTGAQAFKGGAYPALSGDGRFVAFASESSDLVVADTNKSWDIFVRDMVGETTERVNVSANGEQADRGCSNPSISADGRFVAFESLASNLVPGAGPAAWSVIVHDRLSGANILVSTSAEGTPANSSSLSPSISADGSRVAFKSLATNLVRGDGNGEQDVFVRDLLRGTTECVSLSSRGAAADTYSSQPTISADGEHVGFFSAATNLVPNDTNGEGDVFVRSIGKVRPR